MTLRAAAEQALDTLEHVQAHIGRYDPPVVTTIARAMQPTIDAQRAALAAEQPQQRDVRLIKGAWIDGGYVIATPASGVPARTVLDAVTRLAEQSQPEPSAVRGKAYDALDRCLRNNLDDADYAEASSWLKALYAAAPAASDLSEIDTLRWERDEALRRDAEREAAFADFQMRNRVPFDRLYAALALLATVRIELTRANPAIEWLLARINDLLAAPVKVAPAPEAKDDALGAPAEPYPNAGRHPCGRTYCMRDDCHDLGCQNPNGEKR